MITSKNNSQYNEMGSKAHCLPFEQNASKGIWAGDNPLDYPYPLSLAQIILVVLTSTLLYCFLRPLGQTRYVCNLLAGIILGPSLLGYNKAFKDKILFGVKEVPLFETIAHLGVIYSLFLATVKFDVNMVKRMAKKAWKIGLVTFLFPSAITSSTVFTIGRTIPGIKGGKFFLFFVSISLSFTYFPVVLEALDELNLMTSELGQLTMSSAAMNEIVQWTFAAAHLIHAQKTINNGFKTCACLLGMIFFTIFVIRPVIKLIIKVTPQGKEVKESYVIALQLGVLVMSFISDTIGMRSTYGPILLGLVIPNGPPLGSAIVHKTEYVVSEFLLPLFFFRIGFDINVYSVEDWTSFTKLQLLIVVSYVAKIVGGTVIAWCCKIRFKNSILLSLMMSTKGIIELIVYTHWRELKAIDDQCFTQLVLSSLGITMIVTPLVRYLYKPFGASKSILPRFRNIQSMPSNKSEMFRLLCCVHNEESVPNIITLLEASNPTESSPICAYIVHAVELIGCAAPLLLPCHSNDKRNKLCSKNTTTHQIIRAFDKYSKTAGGPVISQPYTMISPYKSMHETLFRLADDKFVPLIIITFHENYQGIVGPSMTAGIRQFNANVQSYSPCTVGILVDKGLSCRMSLPHFSFNVAVFFVGGADDREVLAYAERMSCNPNVGITVFRITLQSTSKEGKEAELQEAKLDEALVNDFRLKNMGNHMLLWREIEVHDGVQLMDAVMNSQGEYDLVMVGRRHSDMTLRDEEMAAFVENAELGVIGDIVASSDFCGGTVNVLVIQESIELGFGAFRSVSRKESESGLSSTGTKPKFDGH
ncbi:hypothetical protein ACFX13_042286 [Malus domestica]